MLLWGFGFTNAAILGWLAAAAAPLLIHLWNRRRYREVRWAAMQYLLAAARKNARRLRIEHALLLLVRTLAIVLAVLAAAQPVARLGVFAAATGQRVFKVLVLDGSYSMAYQVNGLALFDRARQMAMQIVNDSRQGDGFALVLMADPPRVVVSHPATDARDFLSELEGLQLVHGGADLPATLAKVESLCREAAGQGLARCEVFFLSDLARNTWSPKFSGEQAAQDFRLRLERLAQLGAMVVVDLGQDQAENNCITQFGLTDALAIAGRDLQFAGQLRHFGRNPGGEQRLALFVDGHRTAETSATLGSDGLASFSFKCRFETPGDHTLEVRTGGDALPLDDVRYATLTVRDAIGVLCVNGKPGPKLLGAADFVQLALDPQADSRLSPAHVEVILESGLAERDLAELDCLFLCNVGQLTAREAQRVASFVRGGGGVALWLGDQVLAERYNLLLHDDAQSRLLPGRLQDIVSVPGGSLHVDTLGYRHPLVREFSGHEDAGLLQVLVQTYWRLTLPAAGSARAALAVQGGDPLLVAEEIGRGRVVVLTTDGSLSSVRRAGGERWSSLPGNPSFPALVQEMVQWLVSTRGQGRNVAVLEPLGGLIAANEEHASWSMQTPLGRQPVRIESQNGETRWSFADTTVAGQYRLDRGAEPGSSLHFAVNVDASEGDLQKIDPAELPEPFANRLQASEPQDAAALARPVGVERPLLLGVLGLLLVEMVLARLRAHSPQARPASP